MNKPDLVLADGDPGDDMQRRIRYQNTYAAIMSLDLVSHSPQCNELFCEHHDDILLKRLDGRFSAIQVKTKETGEHPWKTSDATMKQVLDRFIEMEKLFGDQFFRYTIASNYLFLLSDAVTSFKYVTSESLKAVGSTKDDMPNKLFKFVRGVATRCVTDESTVLNCLRKLTYNHDLPKIDDIDVRLREQITVSLPKYLKATIPDLKRGADALVAIMGDASSLKSDQDGNLFKHLFEDPVEEEVRRKIEGKKICSQSICDCLKEAIVETSLLKTGKAIVVKDIPSDLTRAEKKMAKGGLSQLTIDSAQDWHVDAEHLIIEWNSKYGPEEAQAKYDHLTSIVRSECSKAYEKVQVTKGVFGPQMMTSLREGIKERLNEELTETFTCIDEHLLGIAIHQTGLCNVWWSEQFELV